MADFGLFYGRRCEADKRYVSSQVQTAGWEKHILMEGVFTWTVCYDKRCDEEDNDNDSDNDNDNDNKNDNNSV